MLRRRRDAGFDRGRLMTLRLNYRYDCRSRVSDFFSRPRLSKSLQVYPTRLLIFCRRAKA